ncbi:MAG: MaoC family dehydratase [Candidatus Caldarchaeum sp.]|nr:MaoC family dehydratase [Candidatus Caldarchaeum sp.]
MTQTDEKSVPWNGEGPYFEDFKPGMRIKSWPGRTFTEYDNYSWLSFTGDCTPLYIDKEYAKVAEFGKVVIHPLVVLNALLSMSVKDSSINTMAFLQCEYMKIYKPLYLGDTLYVETEVVEVRESKSRPYAGIVTWIHRGYNQNKELIGEMKRTNLVYKRESSPWHQYLNKVGLKQT